MERCPSLGLEINLNQTLPSDEDVVVFRLCRGTEAERPKVVIYVIWILTMFAQCQLSNLSFGLSHTPQIIMETIGLPTCIAALNIVVT